MIRWSMMNDIVIDKAWADVQPFDFVRWATPRFVKYGRVIEHHKGSRSLLIHFVEDAQPRALPDAKWYYTQFKLKGPDTEEHLCVIDYQAWYNGPPVEPFIPLAENAHELFINVHEACEFLGFDPKRLRGYIRRGVIPAFKDNQDQWRMNRERLRDVAVKHGWL
jgi:hypothetical protein